MNSAIRAALYSAVLFPGCGQLYLKHYKKGFIFIISTLSGMLSLGCVIIAAGLSIIKSAPFKKGSVQFADVISVTVKALQSINFNYFILMILLMMALWILSIADAYQTGKKQEKDSIADAAKTSTSESS